MVRDVLSTTHRGTCHPRIGILGNPSDGYGGRVLAACFENFEASATVHVTSRPSHGDILRILDLEFADVDDLRQRIVGLDGVESLLAAAWIVFDYESTPGASAERRFELSATTDIPMQVGLSGSSALLIAALRALMREVPEHRIDTIELARLALRAELEILGIAAGPQDRLIQSFGGCAHLDFADHDWRLEPLDARRLPELGLLYNPEAGRPSGDAHSELRRRFESGDAVVVGAMQRFAELADEGRDAMQDLDGDAVHRRFAELIAESWDLRLRCYPTTEEDRAVANESRAHGVDATLAGSGGALVLAARDGDVERLESFQSVASRFGYRFLRPQFVARESS